MLTVTVDERKIRQMYSEKIAEKIKEAEVDLVYWDKKELVRRTCMSWESILKYFFYDKRFRKFKIGGKWYFPAKEAKEFLLEWISEQDG